jgi:lysophospholipase L1-like esterase
VMPLGDSVTYGAGGSGGAGGYRIPLWDQLVTTDGDAIDFVGTQKSGDLPDPDNEGHLGYQITDATMNIDSWLKSGKPSVILLHLGTNDLNQGVSPAVAQTRLDTLLRKIYADIPTVTVVVAGIIQMNPASAQVTAYDALIPALVTKYSAAGKHIQFVDMSATLDPAMDYSDNLHPNQGGYDKMAAAWAPVLTRLYGASAAR